MNIIKDIRRHPEMKKFYFDKPIILKNVVNYIDLETFFKEQGIDSFPAYKTVGKGKLDKKVFSLKEYTNYLESTRDCNPWYVSNLQLEELEVNLPKSFENWLNILPKQINPNWQWVFVGPKNSHTEMHIDVLNSSAWNALITGEKNWTFYPPEKTISEGYLSEEFRDLYSSELNEPIKIVQNQGDLIVTPSGWAHKVSNAKQSFSITGNFINESNYQSVKKFLEINNKPDWIKVINKIKKEYYDN